jgi:DNA-binding CsgD family transcriptional regulator/tetratricopeptide (TPR) repeat protein
MMGGVASRVTSPVLAGRVAEAAQLWGAFERAVAGWPAVVVVAGEAGVGKTRLVAELMDRAREQGGLALAGGCLDVGDGVVAYGPIVEALRSLGGLLEPKELERVLGGAHAELARLVPELGMATASASGPDGSVGAESTGGSLEPGRLFELLLGMLHRVAEDRTVMVVVEDLHWADQSTRNLLGFLHRNLRAGVALVLTYRSDELHRRHPLRPFLAELERSGRVEWLQLRRLDRRALAALLAGVLDGPAPPALLDEIQDRSGGNPFFAEELLAARREEGEEADLPEALRDLLLARVERLPQVTQRLLQVAAVAGRRVDHALLAEVARQPPELLVDSLREAVAHHLLVAHGGSQQYEFRHALVQEAIYDDLLPVQRPPLHAAYARALAARIEAKDPHIVSVGELGQLAYHWYAAHDLGQALLASVQAGQAAEAAFAQAEAVQHYERALQLWQQAPDAAARSPLDRGMVLQRAAQAASLAGDRGRAVALIKHALTETDAAAAPRHAGALLERLARYHWLNGDPAAAMTAGAQAVATIPPQPPSAERARALAAQGQLLMLEGRYQAAVARCEEAVAAATQVSDRAAEGHALNSLGTALSGLGHVEAGVLHLQRARGLAEELGDPDDLCRAHLNLGCLLLTAGRYTDAVASLRDCRELARRFGAMRTYGAAATGPGAEALLYLGRLQEADRWLEEALDLDLPPLSMVHVLLARGLRRLWTGDLDAAWVDLTWTLERSGIQLPSQEGAYAVARAATVAIWQGRLEDARKLVSDWLARLAHVDDADLVAEVCLAGLGAEAAIAERAAAGHAREAQKGASSIAAGLLDRARAVTDTDGVAIAPAVRAKLLTAEAEWSRVVGHGDPDPWAEAAGAWDALGAPWPAVYARWHWAEALLGRGARQPATAVLQQAWTSARQLRASPLLSDLESLARRARIGLEPEAAAGARPGAAAAPEPASGLGLTPRELEVLRLLVQGHSNRQIAERLFISSKTASVHVTNILTKLGVHSRLQAAAVARRLGLDQPPQQAREPTAKRPGS